jgi:hypothetical protein
VERQLGALADRLRADRHTGIPEPGEWRHGDLPTHRPDVFPRPAAERELIPHTTFAGRTLSRDEAAFDLGLLDYEFLLFTDEATGEDTVARREPGTGPVAFTPAHDAPVLTRADAVARLDVTDEPFVFFVETPGGRGQAVYRRYDGHYGLVHTAGPQPAAA